MAIPNRLKGMAGWRPGSQGKFSLSPAQFPDVGMSPSYDYPGVNEKTAAKLSAREYLFGSIAAGAGPMRTRVSTYPATALNPVRIGDILVEADIGITYRYADMCQQILQRDGHLFAVDRARRVEVAGKEFRMHAADETDEAKALRGFMETVVDGVDSFDQSCYSMLSSNCVGYSGTEIIHREGSVSFRGPSNKTLSIEGVFPRSLQWVHGKHFVFSFSNDEPLLDLSKDGKVPLDPNKFIFHRANGDGIAATRGYIRPVVWLHYLKQTGLRDWGVFLRLFGIPNIWAKISRKLWEDPEYRTVLESALRDFGNGTPAVLLDDMDVQVTPATAGTGSDGVHDKLVGFCNAEISKVVQGETLTTELSQTGGYNTSKTHEATMHGTVKMDGVGLANTMRSQFFRAVLNLNKNALCSALGITPARLFALAPKCGHQIEFDMSPLDRANLMDVGVNKLGVPIGISDFYRGFAFNPPRPGEATLKGAPIAISKDGATVSTMDAGEGTENHVPPADATEAAPGKRESSGGADDHAAAKAEHEKAKADAVSASAAKIELTSTDLAVIVTVDEARKSQGLPPIGGADGNLTIAEFKAKHEAIIAKAAAATDGSEDPKPSTE